MFIYLLLDGQSPKEEDLYVRSNTVMKVAYFSDVYCHPSFEETKASGDFVAGGSIKFYHTIAFLCEKYETEISKTRLKVTKLKTFLCKYRHYVKDFFKPSQFSHKRP
jgi:hypothetical protein